jgi:hypothetical protein
MTADPTASAQREMIASGQPQADLAADQGQHWTTGELQRDFEVIGFAAPFVVVKRGRTASAGRWSKRTARGSTSAGGPTMRRRRGYDRPMSRRRLRRYLWRRLAPWAIRSRPGWR